MSESHRELVEPFGRYIMKRRLGAGGMAEVFLAYLPGPGGFRKDVVIKRLRPELANNDRYRSMFLDEARLTARFNHSGLVPLFELVQIEDAFGIVMEYVEGVDFAKLLSTAFGQGRTQILPCQQVLALMARAADTLHYVHTLQDDRGRALRIVHRDVTPSNLLVTLSGELKILDFGVVDYADRSPEFRDDIAGTLRYMPPEQRKGEVVDARSDIYGLAASFFEIATVTPFAAERSMAETRELLSARGVPEPVADVFAGMLAHEPSERFADARSVFRVLDRELGELGWPATEETAHAIQNQIGRLKPDDLSRGRTSLSLREAKTQPVSVDENRAGLKSRRARWLLPAASALVLLLAGLAVRGGYLGRDSGLDPATQTTPPIAAKPPLEPTTSKSAVKTTTATERQQRKAVDVIADRRRTSAVKKRIPPSDRLVALQITSEPPTNISIDGVNKGRTPIELKLPKGPVELLLTNEAFGIRLRRELLVVPGRSRHHVTLRKGKLAVAAVPWAHVFIDDRKIGTTPISPVELFEGEHELLLTNPNLGSKRRVKVNVTAGRTTRVGERLTP